MNHYEVLGSSPSASARDLRRAYIEAARRHHPDQGGDPDAMRRLNEAWAVLGDPTRRRRYDATLVTSAEPVTGPAASEDTGWFEPAEDDNGDEAHGTPLPAPLVMFPAGLFAASVATGSLALVLDEPVLVGLAVLVLCLSMVAVAAVTLLAMRAAPRRHR